jgi:hypothetical protein
MSKPLAFIPRAAVVATCRFRPEVIVCGDGIDPVLFGTECADTAAEARETALRLVPLAIDMFNMRDLPYGVRQ